MMSLVRKLARTGMAAIVAVASSVLGFLASGNAPGAQDSYGVTGMMLGGGIGTILGGIGTASTTGRTCLVMALFAMFCLGVTIRGFYAV